MEELLKCLSCLLHCGCREKTLAVRCGISNFVSQASLGGNSSPAEPGRDGVYSQSEAEEKRLQERRGLGGFVLVIQVYFWNFDTNVDGSPCRMQ
jgi:hypothetical protein